MLSFCFQLTRIDSYGPITIKQLCYDLANLIYKLERIRDSEKKLSFDNWLETALEKGSRAAHTFSKDTFNASTVLPEGVSPIEGMDIKQSDWSIWTRDRDDAEAIRSAYHDLLEIAQEQPPPQLQSFRLRL